MVNFYESPFIVNRVDSLNMILLESLGDGLKEYSVTPGVNGNCTVKFKNSLGEQKEFTGSPIVLYNFLFISTDENIAWRLENGVI